MWLKKYQNSVNKSSTCIKFWTSGVFIKDCHLVRHALRNTLASGVRSQKVVVSTKKGTHTKIENFIKPNSTFHSAHRMHISSHTEHMCVNQKRSVAWSGEGEELSLRTTCGVGGWGPAKTPLSNHHPAKDVLIRDRPEEVSRCRSYTFLRVWCRHGREKKLGN